MSNKIVAERVEVRLIQTYQHYKRAVITVPAGMTATELDDYLWMLYRTQNPTLEWVTCKDDKVVNTELCAYATTPLDADGDAVEPTEERND
jgi:hypothetical protein